MDAALRHVTVVDRSVLTYVSILVLMDAALRLEISLSKCL